MSAEPLERSILLPGGGGLAHTHSSVENLLWKAVITTQTSKTHICLIPPSIAVFLPRLALSLMKSPETLYVSHHLIEEARLSMPGCGCGCGCVGHLHLNMMPPRSCGFSLLSLTSAVVGNSLSQHCRSWFLALGCPCGDVLYPHPKTWPSANLGCWMKQRNYSVEIPKQSFSSLMPAELSDSGRNSPMCTQPVLSVSPLCAVCVQCVQCMSSAFMVCLPGTGHAPEVHMSSQWLAGQSFCCVYKGVPRLLG